MAGYQPALPDIPRYTHWGQVPVGLFTKTQLAQMEPPRKPAKNTAPVGQVLYHGNSYAPLYALADTILKRTASPAQKTVLERARRLQFVCRFCSGRQLDEFGEAVPLGKGRTCNRCAAVRRIHDKHQEAAEQAKQLHARLTDRTAVLLTADDAFRPRQLSLARPLDFNSVRQVLTVDLAVPGDQDAVPGALEPNEAFTLIGRWLTESATDEPLLICWSNAHSLRYRLRRLLVAELPDPDAHPDRWSAEARQAARVHAATLQERAARFPWLAEGTRNGWRSFHETYTRFRAEPSNADDDPTRFQSSWDTDAFDAAATAPDKNTVLWTLLETTAQGQGVSSRAPWLLHPEALDKG
ncbi:hypothetical protein [Actinocorallia libanotica]|uniref:Uncharacterized protein n=1 Tax=Actinocorallia libanotica TaxID=46162 RepID=A0ABN1S006_9ACTN